MEAEALIVKGTESTTNSDWNWGDYTSMQMSIKDGCTFLYTNQYYVSGDPQLMDWSTGLAAISFPTCK